MEQTVCMQPNYQTNSSTTKKDFQVTYAFISQFYTNNIL